MLPVGLEHVYHGISSDLVWTYYYKQGVALDTLTSVSNCVLIICFPPKWVY